MEDDRGMVMEDKGVACVKKTGVDINDGKHIG